MEKKKKIPLNNNLNQLAAGIVPFGTTGGKQPVNKINAIGSLGQQI